MRFEPSRAASSSSSFDGLRLGEAQQVLLRARVEPPEQREISSRMRPRFVSGFELSRRGVSPSACAVGLGLLAPERQQRTDDAVLAPRLDPARDAARDEPVEDGLDLVRGGVAGRAQAVAGEGVAHLAQGVFGRPRGRRCLDDLGAEHFAAVASVLLGLGPAETVVDVQGGDAVPELAQRVPEAGRVGAAGDECRHVAAGRNQLVPADVLLDPRSQRLRVDGLGHQRISER